MVVINVGIRHFYESFRAQKIPAVQVAWKPSLEKELMEMLRKIL